MAERAKKVPAASIEAEPAGQGTVWDEAAGQFVCDFVSRLPTTDTGQPFQLYPWQRDALMEFYGTMEEESGELNAEVYICAADKESAGIVFRAAVFMLETALWTAKMVARGELRISKSQKKIEYRRRVRAKNGGYAWVTMGIMAVLSAEAYSKHGYKPSCVIFDELHAQPNRPE